MAKAIPNSFKVLEKSPKVNNVSYEPEQSYKEPDNETGYKDNWATTTKKREGIPYEACVLVSRKFNVTMDYLLFGVDILEDNLDSKLINAVFTGVFCLLLSTSLYVAFYALIDSPVRMFLN
jgi:hypothetical protein